MTSLLRQEIDSQPEVIARLLEVNGSAVARLLDSLPAFDTIVVAGRGSSHHAGIYAQYILGALTGSPSCSPGPPCTPSPRRHHDGSGR